MHQDTEKAGVPLKRAFSMLRISLAELSNKSFLYSYRKGELKMKRIGSSFFPDKGADCTRIMGRVLKVPAIVGFICFPPFMEML
ncbi:hypothetical protein [Oscillibacter sp.]|uniref:hypothetical protein n=1 Tax=Oscillibacter sp. TaxID=1945593 RepID=UPI002899F94A|nr:hypothetical protein [Oscillibacter sp.]